MSYRVGLMYAALVLSSSVCIATNPAPQPRTLNWSLFCPSGQSLLTGCMPNCTSGSVETVAACTNLFNFGQVEQLTGVPLPYLSNGVVLFSVPQTTNSGASFNVIMGAGSTGDTLPPGFGYMCEILNSNGTPATLWDVSSIPNFSTSIITLDTAGSPSTPYTSDNFQNTVFQPAAAGSNHFWYNNPKNPLYMICLSYQVTAANTLASYTACSGGGNPCVSLSLA